MSINFSMADQAHIRRADWQTAGDRLAANTRLKKLTITDPTLGVRVGVTYERLDEAWAQFCEAVSCNRSIEDLRIRKVTDIVARKPLIESVSRLLEHNHKLRCLELQWTLTSSDFGPAKGNVSSLASALEKCAGNSSLEELCICDIMEGGFLKPISGAENTCKLIAALEGHKNLTKLELASSNVAMGECKALGELLEGAECNIADLSLEGNRIDDACIEILMKTLANRSTLKSLNLSKNRDVTSPAWQAFFVALQTSNLNLDGLNLGENNIDDAALAAFAEWLKQPNNNLSYLNLDAISAVTPRGWLAFIHSLVNQPVMEELHLNRNSIDAEGALCLANTVSNSLRKLYISGGDGFGNDSITIPGWQSLSGLLQNKSMTLEKLSVGSAGDAAQSAFATIDEGVLAVLANALSGNNTLEALEVFIENTTNGPRLPNILCDTSSINATFSSNHTLQKVAPGWFAKPLRSYLEMNQNPNKRQVARQKILLHHFSGDNVGANFELFLEMATSELPHALAWMGRDDAGFFLLHRLICCMPDLVERKSTNVAGAKRASEE